MHKRWQQQISRWISKAAAICLLATATLPVHAADLAGFVDGTVADYRKAIVVMAAPDDALPEETRRQIGHFLFHRNRARATALVNELSEPAQREQVKQLLAALATANAVQDADRLAFRDVYEDLRAAWANDPELSPRFGQALAELKRIEATYEKELKPLLERLGMRGAQSKRPTWDEYLRAVRQQYPLADVLAEFKWMGAFDSLRGKGGKAAATPASAGGDEWMGGELPPKTLLLTFDDGPHAKHTDAILAILKKYQVSAIFFQVGQNLGEVKGGKPALRATSAVAKRVLAGGHALANHSLTHSFLPKLEPGALQSELDNTGLLLKEVAADHPLLTRWFRAPYGARNPAVMGEVWSRQLKSMMWNIDSKDWADPIPSSIAERVLKTVDEQGRGIVLFHDIHARTVEALPVVLDKLIERGYQFAAWDGKNLRYAQGVIQQPAARAGEGPIYRDSHAVIIGVDSYKNWPKLRYAANDAKAMRDLLVDRFKFKPANVHLLLNENATREKILSVLGDTLADPQRVKREDRVFVFFAGHGATRKLPSGRDLGYIVPVEAATENFHGQAISMTQFQDIAEAIPAKHLLFVMDSCYSGLALTRGASTGKTYVREIARRQARQMFTAGGADEQVADNGPNGHSIFTWTLLQGLQGKADLNNDGYITAAELATHVSPVVSTLSRQTPAFGNLVGSEGGDMVFELDHETEFLGSESKQLDDEAVALSEQIAKLKAEISQKASRNDKLKAELVALQSGLPPAKATPLPLPPAEAEAPTAAKLNDQGTQLFKEKQYAEALKRFEQAAALDPKFALAANNLGYTLSRLERHADAVVWYERTLAIDAKRAVAWLNYGDSLVKLNRKADARAAFEKYLELAPAARGANYAREQLKLLEQ